MEQLIWKKHPFRLLLYLEWSLLGIALLAALFPLLHQIFNLPPPPFHPRSPMFRSIGLVRPTWELKLGSLASIITLGVLGLRLPKGAWWQKILYTSFGFGLSWLAILLGGRGSRILPPLLLIVVIRGCLMFPWKGRILVATTAYGSFLLMWLMSILRIKPLGFPISKPLPFARHLTLENYQAIVFNWMLHSGLLFGLVLVFVVLLVGSLVAQKQSRQQLIIANRRLRQYALLIENQATLQERSRIAREIHDSVGHSLAAQSIQLENVVILLPDKTGKLAEHLNKARQLGKEALQNVRQSVASLRTHPLQGKSLSTAIKKLIESFSSTHGIAVEPQIYLPSTYADEINIALYRVIQEALTNIAKHSEATQVDLELKAQAIKINLVIEDNGRGFNPEENTTGFGLQSMRERIEALGGSFNLQSHSDGGCTILVELPFSSEHDPYFTS